MGKNPRWGLVRDQIAAGDGDGDGDGDGEEFISRNEEWGGGVSGNGDGTILLVLDPPIAISRYIESYKKTMQS